MTRRSDLRRAEQALTRISRIGTGREAARRRAERSGVHLSRPSISILLALHSTGPQRYNVLAQVTDLEPPLVSREVRDLVTTKLVKRTPDPSDGRAAIVTLTTKGRRTVERHLSAADDIFDETFQGWSAADVNTLADLLERVVDDFRSAPARSSK